MRDVSLDYDEKQDAGSEQRRAEMCYEVISIQSREAVSKCPELVRPVGFPWVRVLVSREDCASIMTYNWSKVLKRLKKAPMPRTTKIGLAAMA